MVGKVNFLKTWQFMGLLILGGLCTVMAGEKSEAIFPYDYVQKDLDNGLRVILIPTETPNIVSLHLTVQVGSRNEVEPGKSGFAHFFEHMMFRGTEAYPPEKYGEILKNAGADQNAFTSDDLTNYHLTFSKEDLETVLMLEADRFQNLKYPEDIFRTEAKAILGEYNKNVANPFRKMWEVMRNAGYQKHTYKHTTMGFLQDIENMPNQYDYSLAFFDRYYRPEKCVLTIVGDVDPDKAMKWINTYFGRWERGSYKVDIPVEPPSTHSVYAHVPWPSPSSPWIAVGFHGPAYSDEKPDKAVMDIMASLAFSSSSELYQKLVIEEQKVDVLFPYFPDRKDPHPATVFAQVKDVSDLWYVRDELLKAFARLRTEPVAAGRLKEIKSNLRYGFASSLVDAPSIALSVATTVALTRDPQSLNRQYALYDGVTPEMIQSVANKYFTEERQLTVSLSHQELPEVGNKNGSVNQFVASAQAPVPELDMVQLATASPLVDFRILFRVGGALDPEGMPGLAELTARMLAGGGSEEVSFKDIQKAFFPMAAGFGVQVDKEVTVFTGTVHRDNLNAYFDLIRGQLLTPGWREEDFRRVKSNLISEIKNSLVASNDEELGKELLYEMVYEGHPYGRLTLGHIQALEKITLDDIKRFYGDYYNQSNLTFGLAGGYDDAFLAKAKRAFSKLPKGLPSNIALPKPRLPHGIQVGIVQKDTRGTAISMGFPIEVNRAHPDFAALWLARSYFGEHRSSNSHLFQRIREIRGMNYGDYAYIEYFPRGMFQFHPDPNLARQHQIFQIWIRPVPAGQGHFAMRLAKYELDKLIDEGMSEEDFAATRNYLTKFVNVLTQTQSRQLGYTIDGKLYGIDPDFPAFIKSGLAKLTLEDVNAAIRKHLRKDNFFMAVITKDAEGLRKRLISGEPSPMAYDVAKPAEILEEDKIVQEYHFPVEPGALWIKPMEDIFQ